MNYAEMSDLQINIAVASKLGVNAKVKDGALFTSKIHHGENVISVTTVTNYCNNPSDAWLIIDGVIKSDCIVQILKAGVIVALAGGGRIQCMHKNPLRAAMIVFLMMNEGK